MSDFLDALETPDEELRVSVEGAELHFSHLNKELWPGVTKRGLARYYATVGDTLLSYLKDRPLSFVRCPEGVDGERFFQKHWDRGRPDFVETVSVHSDSNGGPRDFLVCNNLPTLLWLAQMAAVELNPWNSRADDPNGDYASSLEALEDSDLNRPDYLVFDLDPHFHGKASAWRKDEWQKVVEVCLAIKKMLDAIGLKGFIKSSGKAGAHIFVPMKREYTYDEIRAATRTMGAQVQSEMGGKVTLEASVKKRPVGVFIDANQNVRGKTMAAAYSPRASEGAGVSMPLDWDELSEVNPTQFTVVTAAGRLSKKGDPWRNINQSMSRQLLSGVKD
jgi:bifunctional non-homologous end joining protein LigD